GTLQHEIEHIYQMIMSDKPLLNNILSKDIYKTAEYLIHKNDAINKIIGYVIYYNNKFEKDAFANGIYKKIMDNPSLNEFDILKQDTTYQNILIIKKYVVENTNNELKNKIEPVIKKQFNKSYKWFYNIANSVIKNYINKIGKVLVKAQQDKYTVILDDTPIYDNLKNKENFFDNL
ncbi:MAG: hypothetical protein J6O41_01815, partial [Clostridia bacterium]|nr:hypothetical protein [Clostridia bacterium]